MAEVGGGVRPGEIDLDAGGVEGGAKAGGFHQGFLGGPQTEEMVIGPVIGEGVERAAFPGCADDRGEFVVWQVGASLFNVDAHGTRTADDERDPGA